MLQKNSPAYVSFAQVQLQICRTVRRSIRTFLFICNAGATVDSVTRTTYHTNKAQNSKHQQLLGDSDQYEYCKQTSLRGQDAWYTYYTNENSTTTKLPGSTKTTHHTYSAGKTAKAHTSKSHANGLMMLITAATFRRPRGRHATVREGFDCLWVK